MWYSFTPLWGWLKGVVYYLPTTDTDSRTSRRNSTLQTMAGQDGDYDSAGTAPMPLSSGNLNIVFSLYTSWYVANPNKINYYYGNPADDIVARENALLHLAMVLISGGQGTLIYELKNAGHPSLTDPYDQTTIDRYSFQAKLGGDLQVDRTHSTAKVTVPFIIQSGSSIGTNGREYPFF